MPVQDRLCFVQFMHPGREHRAYRDGVIEWNRTNRPHKRKFVQHEGRCVRNSKEFQGPLRFWAEWEPESELIGEFDGSVTDGPRFVCRPFYHVHRSYEDLQNTDPCVFGGFFYTGCQQHRGDHPTQLSRLSRGSVVLFGSRVGQQFAIDTVFVVDRSREHKATDVRKLKRIVPRVYWDVTLAAWYKKGSRPGSRCVPASSNRTFRLYWGATYNAPVNGMYSFFPCLSADRCPAGFPRPVIEIPHVVNDRLGQGFRLVNKHGLMSAEVQRHWEKVRKQVEGHGLWLGVSTEMPERVSKRQVRR